MSHSVIDIKRYYRELGYGDYKEIRERLLAKGIEVSKSAITQVMGRVYYNQDILDMAKEVLKEKENGTEKA
jgi:uncharacterized protein (DUF2164 family)